MGFVSQISFEQNYLLGKRLDEFDSEKGKDFENTTKFKFVSSI